FETLLDNVRSKKIGLTPGCLKTMLKSADLLADLVKAARTGADGDEARTAALAAELSALAGGGHPVAAAKPTMPVIQEPPAPTNTFEIRFRARPDLYAKANDPALLLRELGRLGKAAVTCDSADLPLLSDLDPEGAYLTWKIRLETDKSEKAVREVFEFV